jgi:hypothetical protein
MIEEHSISKKERDVVYKAFYKPNLQAHKQESESLVLRLLR